MINSVIKTTFTEAWIFKSNVRGWNVKRFRGHSQELQAQRINAEKMRSLEGGAKG